MKNNYPEWFNELVTEFLNRKKAVYGMSNEEIKYKSENLYSNIHSVKHRSLFINLGAFVPHKRQILLDSYAFQKRGHIDKPNLAVLIHELSHAYDCETDKTKKGTREIVFANRLGIREVNDGKIKVKIDGLDEIINEAKTQILINGDNQGSNILTSKKNQGLGRNQMRFYSYDQLEDVFHLICSAYGTSNIGFLKDIEGKNFDETCMYLDTKMDFREGTSKDYLSCINKNATESIKNLHKVAMHTLVSSHKILSLLRRRDILSKDDIDKISMNNSDLYKDIYKKTINVMDQRLAKLDPNNEEQLRLFVSDVNNIDSKSRFSEIKLGTKVDVSNEITKLKNSFCERTNKTIEFFENDDRELINKLSERIADEDRIEYNFDNENLIMNINDLKNATGKTVPAKLLPENLGLGPEVKNHFREDLKVHTYSNMEIQLRENTLDKQPDLNLEEIHDDR